MQAPIKEKKPKVLIPAGSHLGRVIGIIYIGTITEKKINPQNKKEEEKKSYKIRITWELPNLIGDFNGEKKPFVITKKVTLSMYKMSALRPIVHSLIGVSLTDEEADGFDIDKIIGESCILSIIQSNYNGKPCNQIESTAAKMIGMACPPQVNPSKILSYDKWNEDYFQSLPDFLKEEMEATPEYKKMKNQGKSTINEVAGNADYPSSDIDPSSIPF